MSYHQFEVEGTRFGSFEVFYMTAEEIGNRWDYSIIGPEGPRAGWYWWPCWPACLPDGDPVGPFESEEAAILDARS